MASHFVSGWMDVRSLRAPPEVYAAVYAACKDTTHVHPAADDAALHAAMRWCETLLHPAVLLTRYLRVSYRPTADLRLTETLRITHVGAAASWELCRCEPGQAGG
jgi:hypothetical protein